MRIVSFQILLLFCIRIAFKIDLGHIVALIAAIVVLVIIAKLVVILAVTQHCILDVGSDRIAAAALRWEAYTTNHRGMLILFANNHAHLAILFIQNSGGITIATLHKANQAV